MQLKVRRKHLNIGILELDRQYTSLEIANNEVITEVLLFHVWSENYLQGTGSEII